MSRKKLSPGDPSWGSGMLGTMPTIIFFLINWAKVSQVRGNPRQSFRVPFKRYSFINRSIPL